jgi:hypothetical protein
MENVEENSNELWSDMANMEERLVEMIWKYRIKASKIGKRYENYWRKVSWIVKRYGKCGRKVGCIVKWYGKFGRNVIWNDMENIKEIQVE